MKINGSYPGNIGKLYQAYQTQTEKSNKKTEVTVPEQDNLQLSEQAKKIHELIKETSDLPEIREEKIAKLKEQIKNNTYNISPAKVASKMLSSEYK